MSLRLASPFPQHVIQAARAAIWARAAAAVAMRSQEWDLPQLGQLLVAINTGSVRVWDGALFAAVIDAFPAPVVVEWTDDSVHSWECFAATFPPRVYCRGVEISPKGELPPEAVEAAVRKLSRAGTPGAVITAIIPRVPTPGEMRLVHEALRHRGRLPPGHMIVVDTLARGPVVEFRKVKA